MVARLELLFKEIVQFLQRIRLRVVTGSGATLGVQLEVIAKVGAILFDDSICLRLAALVVCLEVVMDAVDAAVQIEAAMWT